MSICPACNQEMTDPKTLSCTQTEYRITSGPKSGAKFVQWLRLPWEPEGNDPNERCHDCGIAPGMLHHPGCDVELCPRCRGQVITCDCEILGMEGHKYSFLPDGTPILRQEQKEPGHRPAWEWIGPKNLDDLVAQALPPHLLRSIQEENLTIGPGSVQPIPNQEPVYIHPEKWTEEAMWKAFDNARLMYAERNISPMMAWYEVAIQIRGDLMNALADMQRLSTFQATSPKESADNFRKYAQTKLELNKTLRLLQEAEVKLLALRNEHDMALEHISQRDDTIKSLSQTASNFADQIKDLEQRLSTSQEKEAHWYAEMVKERKAKEEAEAKRNEYQSLLAHTASNVNRLQEELNWYYQTREKCSGAWDEIEEEVERLKEAEAEEIRREEEEDGA